MDCTFAFLFPNNADEPPADCSVETAGGSFNFDQRYIFSFLDPLRGPAAMRMKVPTAAKRGDAMTTGPYQVRYWSLCVVQFENAMYTYGCLKDAEFVRDSGDPDSVTLLFSAPQERPTWACDVLAGQRSGCSGNWFPYTSPINWLYFRQLAPAADFAQAALYYQGEPNDYVALQAHMGAYYPAGACCAAWALDRNVCGFGRP